MSKNISDVIEQVQKLMALSTSANANEAAAAAAAANRLIDKYRLTQADLEAESNTVEPIEEASDYLYQTGKLTVWKHRLMHTLTKHYGVAIWNDTSYNTGRKFSRFRMVGRRSDMSVVTYMFSWLTLECERLAALEAKGTGLGRVFVASYQEGFVAGVSDQLKKSREEVRKESTSTAMVLVDARLAESEAALYRFHTNLRTVKTLSQSRTDGRAFSMGKARGAAVNLGSSLSASAGPRMLKG